MSANGAKSVDWRVNFVLTFGVGIVLGMGARFLNRIGYLRNKKYRIGLIIFFMKTRIF